MTLKYAPLDSATESLDVDALVKMITPQTKLVAVAHVSNTLGCVTPAKRIADGFL